MVKFLDFLASLEKTLENGNDEIDRRNAASRAYYAGFHACKELACKFIIDENLENASHDKLITVLKSKDEYKTIGNQLAQAKNIRRKADYFIKSNFSVSDARLGLGQVKRIIKNVERIYATQNLAGTQLITPKT